MSEVRVAYSEGQIGRIVMARILPGTDVFEGITKILQEKNIQNGWVSMIGSLEKTSYFYLEKNESKLGAGYGPANDRTFPVELCGAMGLICQGGLHIHASMCGDDGVFYGGHMIGGSSPSLATVELMIVEVVGGNYERKYDEEAEGNHFFAWED